MGGFVGKRELSRVIAVIAVGALAMVAAPAANAGDTVKTRVDIRYEGAFEGTVKSVKRKCEVRRRVGLYEARQGEAKRIARDRTTRQDPNVSFPGVMPKPNRRYFLIVGRRKVGSLQCEGATSERIRPVE